MVYGDVRISSWYERLYRAWPDMLTTRSVAGRIASHSPRSQYQKLGRAELRKLASNAEGSPGCEVYREHPS
jgi:hypothetical protein